MLGKNRGCAALEFSPCIACIRITCKLLILNDLAVDAVWSEPVSACISLLTGKLTGKILIWRLVLGQIGCKPL
jgi:hypothetical protein